MSSIYDNRLRKQKALEALYSKDKITFPEVAYRTAGNSAGMVFDYLGEPVSGLLGLLNDIRPEKARKRDAQLAKKIQESKAAQAAAQWIKDNPRKAGMIESTFDLGGLFPAGRIVGKGANSVLGNTATLVEGGPIGAGLDKIMQSEGMMNFYALGKGGKGLSLAGEAIPATGRSVAEAFSPSAQAKARETGFRTGKLNEIYQEQVVNKSDSNALGAVGTGRAINAQLRNPEAAGAKGVLGDQWLDTGDIDWNKDQSRITDIMFSDSVEGAPAIPDPVRQWHMRDINRGHVVPHSIKAKLMNPGEFGVSFKKPASSDIGGEIAGTAKAGGPVANKIFTSNNTKERLASLYNNLVKTRNRFSDEVISKNDPRLLMEVAQVAKTIDKRFATKASKRFLKKEGIKGKDGSVKKRVGKKQTSKEIIQRKKLTNSEMDKYNDSPSKIAEHIVKARMKKRFGVELKEGREKVYYDYWMKEKGGKVGRLEDSQGNVISSEHWEGLKVPEDKFVHWASNHHSASKEVGGVRTSQSLDFNNLGEVKLMTTLSDGHDIFDANPVGGKGFLSLTPTMTTDLNTGRYHKIAYDQREKGTKSKELKLRASEVSSQVKAIEELTGILKGKKESPRVHHARAMKEYKAKATPQDYLNVLKNLSSTGVVFGQGGENQ